MGPTALVYNPAAGRRRAAAADRVLATLEAAVGPVPALPTTGPGVATRLAREAAAEGYDTLFALGGDGTLREAAIGLLGTATALAPLPGGTTNVVCLSLGLPPEPVAAARVLLTAGRREIHLGRCGSTHFLMMVSAGFDAEVVAGMDGAAKARWGKLAIAVDALRRLGRYRFPGATVRGPGQPPLDASFVALCNLPHYGGRFVLAPEADLGAPSLELVAHTTRRLGATLGFALALARGRHLSRPDAVARRVTEVELDGPPELALQLDGDVCRETLPVRIGVADQRLWLRDPAAP